MDNNSDKKVRDYYLSAEEYQSLDSEEIKKWAPLNKKYERIPIWCIIAFSVVAVCGILYLIFCISPDFADFFNLYIITQHLALRWL